MPLDMFMDRRMPNKENLLFAFEPVRSEEVEHINSSLIVK